MYYLNVSSNIMSLGGLALAIGVLVDAAIVMVENGYRHLSERPVSGGDGLGQMNDSNGPLLNKEKDGSTVEATKKTAERERVRILIDAAKQVGPALFFSLLIIVVSFLPVFLLEAQEGRMFRPLAWTKTLAVGFSSLLAVTSFPFSWSFSFEGNYGPNRRSDLKNHAGRLFAGFTTLLEIP